MSTFSANLYFCVNYPLKTYKKIQGYCLCSYHFTLPMKGHIAQYLWEKSQLLQNILTSLPTSIFFYTPSCFLPPNPLLCDLIHMSTCDCQAPKGNGVGSRVCQPWIQYLNSFVVNVTTPTCAAVQSSRKTPEPVLLTSASAYFRGTYSITDTHSTAHNAC